MSISSDDSMQAGLASRQRTVVVIDDQSASRAVITRIIGSIDERIAVQAFAAPGAALQWIAQARPALILTDYRMPEMDGIEVTRRLRALANTAHTPIVMVTVVADKSLKRRALEAGATDFLTKPVDHSECRARCRNLLALSEYQTLLREHVSALEARLGRLASAAAGLPSNQTPSEAQGCATPVSMEYRQLYDLTSTIAAVGALLAPLQSRILELQGALRKPLHGETDDALDANAPLDRQP